MNQKLTGTILISISTLIMQKAICQSEKFGQLIYTVPAGWKLAKYQNGALITAPMLREKEFLAIQVMEAINFSGTMQKALDECYNKTCSELQVTKMNEVSGRNYNALEPKRSFKGWEYIRCSGGIQVNNGTPYPDEYGLDLFVVRINNRYERIALIKSRNTCNGLSRYYPSDRLEYRNVIEEFLFSLKFDDWEDQVVKKANVHGDGIIGPWQGIGMSVGLSKPGAALGAELKVQQLIFFSNGQVYFGKNFPVEGLDELNTWIKSENNRRDWGTYTFSNGKGALKMPYADIPLRLDNNKLTITTNKTDHVYSKQKPVDEAKFDGIYSLNAWNGRIPTISFTADGKFIDNGAIRILYHEYIDCLNPAINPGAGTYEVKNYSLLFNYTDGRKIKIAFPGFDFNNNKPNSLLTVSFNNDVLKRQ